MKPDTLHGHSAGLPAGQRRARTSSSELFRRLAVPPDTRGASTMSRGFPSMTALLGLLAVAGFQNRDKLAEMLGGLGSGSSNPGGQGTGQGQVSGQQGSGGLGGLVGSLTGGGGGGLGGGLGGLLGGLGGAGAGGL